MKSTRGFTLIELLVVIAIIGILSSVVLASLNSARSKARDAKRMSDLRQIQIAVEAYFNDNGVYPPCTTSDYDACTTTGSDYPPMNAMAIVPQYIPSISNDPINTQGQYGYYYSRLYKKNAQGWYDHTGLKTDYILMTRLETPRAGGQVGSAFDNTSMNYLLGN